MRPILYNSTESSFLNNGVGILSDAIKCIVKEERNGAFELEMEYPVTGIHYDEIMLQRIILAKPNQTMQTQPFRIYRITRPMNGIVTIYAEHISYDMSGIAISTFTATDINDAFAKLKQHAVGSCPFNFVTDKTTTGTMNVNIPCSMRSQLGGKAGSILDVYGGGEYIFDRYTVRLLQHRGLDNGVVIRYGKNLTDIKQEENCTKVYSAVYPYWINNDTGALKEITGKIVRVSGTFPVERILTYDLSQSFNSEPTEAQMISKTESYINSNGIGIPSVNLDVSFAQLEQSEEYKGLALLERVSLCDTVKVHFPKLGVDATAKAIELTYNVLLDRVESITLGDARTKITDSIFETQEAIEQFPTSPEIASMVALLTQSLIGASGGAVRLLDENQDGTPDTLYIADDPDPTQAVKVWRFNYQGWGVSTTGYQGPYTMGATLETGLVADFITAGTLNAARIAAGSIALSKLIASTANGDGIVKLDGTGMEVSHSGIGTQSKSTLKSDGLKVYDASGNLVGGLYVPTGQSVAKMGSGSLFNPSYQNFSVQLERFFSGESMTYFYGLALYRKNVRICGIAAIDDDSVNDGALIGFNNDLMALSSIIDVVKDWVGHDPSQFVMTGESGGGSGATSHLIYAHGRANVSSSQLRSVDYSAYGFTEIPTVVAQYSQEGSNISGDVGALKIYNKTATGFNMIIGGAQTQPDRDIDWIAIGMGTGKSS